MELLNDFLTAIEYIIEYRFPLQIKCLSLLHSKSFLYYGENSEKMLTANDNIIANSKCMDYIENDH